MTPQPIEYSTDDKGNILLPGGAPFDGSDVLIKIGAGWVEARWMDSEPVEDHEGNRDDLGFCWVCLDDAYQAQELDNATLWCPLPA
jgi:hypothetical protein